MYDRFVLLRVCYERVKFVNPTMASFILSAWWHGFYPAYYCMFVILSLNLMAARKVLFYVLRPHDSVLADASSASSSFPVTTNSEASI